MKKAGLILWIVLLVTGVNAQKVSIEHALDQLGEGYNPTFRIKIPHATEKVLEKKWSGFLKDNDAKVRSSKGQIKGENAIINGLGPDTLQIFSRLSEDEDGMLLKVAVLKNGVFISPTADPDYCKRLETIFGDFAFNQAKEGLNKKIEDTADLLKDTQKEQSDLVRENEHLASDNESMKKKIAQNENTIDDNSKKSDELKQKIQAQQKSLELLRGKLSELK